MTSGTTENKTVRPSAGSTNEYAVLQCLARLRGDGTAQEPDPLAIAWSPSLAAFASAAAGLMVPVSAALISVARACEIAVYAGIDGRAWPVLSWLANTW